MRYILATVNGLAYEIPETWMVGASRSMTVLEAIEHWHEQAQLEKEGEK